MRQTSRWAAAEKPIAHQVIFAEVIAEGPLRDLQRKEKKLSWITQGALVSTVLALGVSIVVGQVAQRHQLNPKIERLQVPASVYKVVEATTLKEQRMRDRFPLQYAVMKGDYAKVVSLIEHAPLQSKDRQFLTAQLDLWRGNTGTDAQKAVADGLRRGESLTRADGQWIYAMEMAADARYETPQAESYKAEALQTGQAWRKAASFAQYAFLAIVLISMPISGITIFLRRRIERITHLLGQLE